MAKSPHRHRRPAPKKAPIRRAQRVIEDAIKANPDVRLVLDIAKRAQDATAEPPRYIGVATDICVVSPSLAYPA